MTSITETEVVSAMDTCSAQLFSDHQFATSMIDLPWDTISLIMSVIVADYLNAKYFPKNIDGVARAKVALVDPTLMTPSTKYVVAIPPSSYEQSKSFRHLIINVPRYVYLTVYATTRERASEPKNDFISYGPLYSTLSDCKPDTDSENNETNDLAMFRLHRLGHHRTFWAIVPVWVRFRNRRLMRSLTQTVSDS